MFSSKRSRSHITMFVLFATALACNLPTSISTDPQDGAADSGEGPPAAQSPDAPPAGESPVPEATLPPTSTSTPTPTVAHSMFPSGPAAVNSYVIDRSTKGLAAERRANADNFAINLLERPYTAEVMDYVGYLDLTRGEVSSNPPWMYVTIYLEEAPPDGGPAIYGVELDLDIDGRGDWLIFGLAPPGTDWTTDGVHVYRDANNNVGGSNPMNSEASNPSWDGYEDHVFDQGYGDDADAAWIRRVPNHPERVQIAFKFSLISDSEFMWGVWADEGVQEPAFFDYNDHFTAAEAGSPVIESSLYPLKALFAVDNSCRWGFGFEPTGSERGVCYVPPTPTPTFTPALGSISGGVYKDYTAPLGSKGPGDPPFDGVTVSLGSGACASSGYASTNTLSDGSYSFTSLPAGTYCVSVNIPQNCGGWILTSATNQYTITLSPGEDYYVTWFGYGPYVC